MTNTLRDDEVEGLAKLAAFIIAWVLGWPSGALRAVVFMKGWEWFVADQFGLPDLTFVVAFGIAVLVSFLTINIKLDSDSDEDGRSLLAKAFVMPMVSVLVSGLYFLSLFVLSWFL